MTLFVCQEYVLVCQDNTHEVDILAMVLIAVLNNRIVEMMVCGNLVTWCNTVTGNNSAVHDFCWIHKGGDKLLGIHAVVICIMQKSL